MRRYIVASSAVRSLGYDLRARRLEVEFPSGEVYDYEGVPPAEVMRLLRAESLGRYLNQHIKPRYPYARLER